MLVGVFSCFVVVDILTLPGLAVKHSQTSFKQAGVRLELFFSVCFYLGLLLMCGSMWPLDIMVTFMLV